MDFPVLVRRVEESDRAWLVDLCKRRYPPHYDLGATEAWIINAVLKNPINFYATRSADAFQITNLFAPPWAPTQLKADVVAICADDGEIWQAFLLLRDSIAWARSRNASHWRFETDTAYDLGPIMRRLGATEVTPRYTLNIKGESQ